MADNRRGLYHSLPLREQVKIDMGLKRLEDYEDEGLVVTITQEELDAANARAEAAAPVPATAPPVGLVDTLVSGVRGARTMMDYEEAFTTAQSPERLERSMQAPRSFRADIGSFRDPSWRNREVTEEQRNKARESLMAEAETARLRAQQLLEVAQTGQAQRAGSLIGQILETVTDVASTAPESAAILGGGIVGGALGSVLPGKGNVVGAVGGAALGAVPMANIAYNSAFTEGMEELALTPEQADLYATVMATAEFVPSVVGGTAGAFAARIGSNILRAGSKEELKDLVANRVKTWGQVAAGTGLAALAEGADEVAVIELQERFKQSVLDGDGQFMGFQIFDSEESRQAFENMRAAEQENWLDNRWRAFRAGALGGATMVGGVSTVDKVMSNVRSITENAEVVGRNVDAAQRYVAGRAVAEEAARAERERIPQQGDMFMDAEMDITRIQNDLELIDTQLAEPNISDEMKTALNERKAVLRRMLPQAEADARAKEQLVDVDPVREALGETEAQGATPVGPFEQGQAQRARENVDAMQRELGGIEAVTAEQQQLDLPDPYAAERKEAQRELERQRQTEEKAAQRKQEADAKAKAEQEAKAKKDHAAARRKELSRLTTAAREAGLTDEQVIDATTRGIAQWDTNNTVEDFIARAADAPSTALPADPRKATARAEEDRQLSTFARPQPTSAPTQSRTPLLEQIKKQANARKMSTQDTDAATQVAEAAQRVTPLNLDIEGITKSAVDFVVAMRKENSDTSTDLLNLVGQGKMVVAPDAASLGRNDGDAAAVYDIDSGTIFLYANQLKRSKNPAAAAMVAIHEAVHGGQFNEREGRATLMRLLLGDAKSGIVDKIQKAATDGNTLAKQALDLWQQVVAADPQQAKFADEEIPAYFATVAASARRNRTGLGRVTGVVNDMVAAARRSLRDKGVKLDVNINDLAAAVELVPGELLRTGMQGRAGGGSRQILGGPRATGFGDTPIADTFPDPLYGEPRFEIDDSTASLNTEAVLEAAAAPDTQVPIDSVLNHDKLFEQYPQLRDYKFVVNSKLNKTKSLAQHNARDKLISVNPAIVAMPDVLASAILHEMNHAVQHIEGFVGGANRLAFAVEDRKRVQQKIDAAMGALNRNPNLSPEAKARLNSILSTAQLELSAIEERAFEIYKRDLGEVESRIVQARQNMTPEERRAKPFYEMLKEMPGEVAIEDVLDTTPLQGRDLDTIDRMVEQQEQGRSNVRAMLASSLTDTPPAPEKGGMFKWVADKFRTSPARTIRRAMEHHSNQRAAGVDVATTLEAKLKRTVRWAAERLDVDPAIINKDIADGFTKLQGLEGDALNEAFNKLAAKYPELEDALHQFRQAVDAATDTIINDIIKDVEADGRDLTQQEFDIMQTLLSQKGKYLHRAYAVFEPQVSRQYSKNLWKQWTKGMANKMAGKNVTGAQKAAMRIISNAINYLNNRMMIPDDAHLAEMTTEQLSDLMQVWGGRETGTAPSDRMAAADKRDWYISQLQSLRESITPKALESMSELAIKEILRVEQYWRTDQNARSARARRAGIAGGDPGILKEKEAVPRPIRELLGEFVDPSVVLLNTLVKQEQLIARTRLLSEVKAKGLGDWILDNTPENVPLAQERGLVQANGADWGPLNTMWIHKDAYKLLQDSYQTVVDFSEALQKIPTDHGNTMWMWASQRIKPTLAAAAGAQKFATLILSPFHYMRNLAGSPAALMMNGNINPVTWWKGFRTGGKLIASTIDPSLGSELADLQRYISLESGRVGELQRILGKQLSDSLKGELSSTELSTMAQRLFESVRATGKTAAGTLGTTYAVMDVWTKIANFYHQVGFLADVYQDLGWNLDAKTEEGRANIERIKRQAGDRTQFTNISYNRVPGILRGAERFGLTMYLPYFAEVFRIGVANYMQAAMDAKWALTDPAFTGKSGARAKVLWHALARLAGTSAAHWGGYQMTKAMGDMLLDDGEEDNRLKRLLLRSYLRDKHVREVGRTEDDKIIYQDTSTMDMLGPITDLVRLASLTDPEWRDYQEYFRNLFIEPRFLPDLWRATLGYQPNMSDPQLARMFPELTQAAVDILGGSDTAQQAVKRFQIAAGSITPTPLKTNFDPRLSIPTGAVEVSSTERLMNMLGAQMYTLDPAQAAREHHFEWGRDRSESQAILNSQLLNRSNLTEADLTKVLMNFRASESERLGRINDLMDAYQAWGYTPRQARDYLKDGGFSEADIRLATRFDGRVRLNLQSLQQAAQRRAGMQSDEERRRTEEIVRANTRLLLSNRAMLRDMGIVIER